MRRWSRLSICLLVSMLPAACRAREAVATTMVRHVLPSGVCADQSSGHFYMAANESSSDFVVYLQGGQGCAHNQSLCEELLVDKPHLFTSVGFPDTIEVHSLLSGDGRENALYSTFNRVYVPYCTMDMYLLDTESSDGRLQFRGRQLLEETLRTVLDTADNGATVVFGGSSAGGVGAFNAASWLLDTFDQVSELSVIMDSAFFFDVQGYLKPLLEYVQSDPSVAYASHCAEEFDGGPCCVQFGCMLQKGHYPSTARRMRGTFLLSSSQDINAGVHINDLGTYEETVPEMLWGVAAHTGQTRLSLRNLASLFPKALSVFSPSCMDHVLLVASELDMAQCVPGIEAATDDECESACVYGDNGRAKGRRCDVTLDSGIRWQAAQSVHAWKTLQINDTSVREAMEQWWEGRGDASKQVRLLDSCDDPHCNASCQGGLLPGGREETDSLFCWTLVLVTLAFAIVILGGGISAAVWSCIQWNQVERIVARRLLQEGVRPTDVRNGTSTTRSAESSGRPLKRRGEMCGGDGTTTLVLEWRGLSYWLPQETGWCLPWWRPSNEVIRHSEKQLLFSVDGAVPAGALCALVGPSGSGKSTLLDLLTGRRTVGRCEGDIFFEGTSIADQQEAYIRNAGYMRQSNIGFLAGLSVFDNLVYAAMIRLQGTLEEKLSRVQTVMEETALALVQNTKAGSLSGGQKRRLMLALELLADRHLLFLDEPTSGVDATAALELVTILKRLSDKVTIIVAIHQPRPEIWQLFSHTILIKSGRVVYCGPAVDALRESSRCLPRPKEKTVVAVQPGAQRHRASFSGRVQPVVCGASVKSEVGRACTGVMTASSGSSDVKGIRGEQDTPDPRRPTLHSTWSRAAGGFKSHGWDSGHVSLHKGPNNRTRGRAIKVGPKVHNLAYAEPGLDTEMAAATDDDDDDGITVPDKILDVLTRIDVRDIEDVRAQEAIFNARDIASESSRCVIEGDTKHGDVASKGEGDIGMEEGEMFQTPTIAPSAETGGNGSSRFGVATPQELTPATSVSSGSPAKRKEEMPGGEVGRSVQERANCTPVWKMAATLLARSAKSGRAVWNFGILAGAMTFMAVAFRAATHDSEMLHLVASVLFSMVLPVLLVYHPLMIENTWEEWPLTKTEIADGFYPSVYVTTRIVFDHLAVGVFGSFLTVGIMHSILWHRFISDLPASELGVNIQLSCGVTLIAWVMISLFDALAISGLHLTTAFSVGVSLTSVWVFFSGTVLLISSIPNVLRAVTYTSPHYWISSFMLRVILDGLDTTGSCDRNNSFYCAKGFGDLFADALGLRMRRNGYNILAVVIFTLAGFAVMVITVERKGRHTGILGGLGQPSSVLPEAMQDSHKVAETPRTPRRDSSKKTTSIKNRGTARVRVSSSSPCPTLRKLCSALSTSAPGTAV